MNVSARRIMVIAAAGFLATMFGLPLSATAEYICGADINYRWKKSGDDKEHEVLWVSLEKRAKDEASGKELIAKLATAEKTKVRQECEFRHENFSACVASKFRANMEVMQKLDFTARKAIEDSVTTDCKSSMGTCVSVVVTEPKCVEKTEGKPEETAAAADDSKAKDAKGKDKKAKK